MANQENDFKARLLVTFRTEAEEHLQALTANLLALDRGLPPAEMREVVEATFREVHTLKGAARSVSLRDVETLCQACESVLSRATRGQLILSQPILNRLQEAVDGVACLLAGSADSTVLPDLIRCLEEAANGAGVRGHPPPPTSPLPFHSSSPASTPIPHTDSVRLDTSKLDALLLQAEDLLVPKLAAEERVREARALIEALRRVTGDGGRGLGVRDQSPTPFPHPPTPALRMLQAQAEDLLRHLAGDQRTISRAVDGLHEELRRTRLTPSSTVLDLFPRMVRDLARTHGKEIEWVAYGADLKVDRKVLEAMKEPLIHLVRNAIDHGIETPEVRVEAGKSGRGRVTVTISSLEGGRIEIRVEDDGGGIDLGRVKAAAVRARLLTAEAAEVLTGDQTLDLIFRSGLSTSPIVTDLSGHGLGLAIVKERAERLGGQIRIETRAGAGTTVRTILPATITTFRGLLVQAGGQPFLLPTEAVKQAIRIAHDAIEHVEGREAIRWNGQPLFIARLSGLLGLSQEQGSGTIPHPPSPNPPLLCVIVTSGEAQVGLLVEDILGDREVLVKEIGPPLVRVKNVAAAGLLGTGQVVLILRPADLLRSTQEITRPPAEAVAYEEKDRQPVLLVVDDSITTRTMEKNLLEAAGYQVKVAVDGMEAWTLLNTEEFDLVVSDVDMPRMDGFDLTTRIRADRKLSELPVVLVTALESRENKERGIEVGANAYILKSSFDQSSLLEFIRRLV
ncbi:response regulator [Candidatus Methylomirabilis sp.]|uniref:hybrid sensor histidine kinase/response regulator n=1 Tax=Candidatus Methylomirabilis sp. TaxID=2032687 RepID=UPI002A5C7E44|nr:response regulator [Candidatus Methylomirabilis sp.]